MVNYSFEFQSIDIGQLDTSVLADEAQSRDMLALRQTVHEQEDG